MKKVFNILLIMAFTLLFVFAAVWDYDVIKWNSGSVSSTGLITTGKDTSDVFDLTYSERTARGRQYQYPEEINFMIWATESAGTDSTNVAFTLDLSNDQTYWINYGTLGTLISATSDPAATTTGKKRITDLPKFKYGRIRATLALPAGDTLSIGAQVSKLYKE